MPHAAALALAVAACGGGGDASDAVPPPVSTNVPAEARDLSFKYSGGYEIAGANPIVPGYNINALDTHDLDQDGRADIVLGLGTFPPAAPAQVPLQILLQQADGRFVDATTSLIQGPAPARAHPNQFVFADFNGDGRPDIFSPATGFDAPPFPGEPNVLLLSTPAGLSDASGLLPTTNDFSHSATAADLDGNGRPDLFVGNIFGESQAAPYLLMNDRSGFSVDTTRLPADVLRLVDGTHPSSLFVDLDNDGFQDLVLGCDNGRTPTRVLFGSASGRFAPRSGFSVPAMPFPDDSICVHLRAVDLDRDGRMDVVVSATRADPFYQGAALQALINTPTGLVDESAARFATPTRTTGPWYKAIDVVDFDGDGHPDLFARGVLGAPSGPASRAVDFIWLNDGTGRFRGVSTSTLPATLFPSFAVAADVDADGRPDLVLLSAGGTRPARADVFLNVR